MRKFVLLALFLFLNSNIAYSQNTTADITLTSIPSEPEALSTVLITANSFSIDIDNVNLEWKYNGKIIASGTGKKSIKITAPENGGTAIISVTASGYGFSTATASIVIRPGSVDMLWEAVDAYTPPFYKGKSLLPHGGIVRVTAIPGTASPKTTTFKWSRNGVPMQNNSGFGKSSIVFKQQELNVVENIEVETNSGVFSGKSSMEIVPQQPSLVAYENKEGFIDYARGWIESVSINGIGAILRFEPYFFSAPISIKNDLSMSIFVDEAKINTNKPNEISLTSSDGSDGSVEVEVFTKEYSLQNARTLFDVIFN